MSLIRRSRRPTSSRAMAIKRCRNSGSSTRSRPSTAERSDASGFFSSWLTSAAKASILSIRWRSDWLMSETARASRPISSFRLGSRGTFTSRARPSRTRCAATARRRSGLAIVRARNIERSTEMAMSTNIAPTMRVRSCRTALVKVRSLSVVEQHAALERHRRRDNRRQVGRISDFGVSRPAKLVGLDRFWPCLEAVDARFGIIVERFRADDEVEGLVEGDREVLRPLLARRIAQLPGGASDFASCRSAGSRPARTGGSDRP